MSTSTIGLFLVEVQLSAIIPGWVLLPIFFGADPIRVVAAWENYDISTSALTERRSASELPGNIRKGKKV